MFPPYQNGIVYLVLKVNWFWSAYKVKKQFTTLFPPPLSSTTQKKMLFIAFSCFLLGSTFTFLSNKHVWLFHGLLILCIIYQLSIIPDRDLICPHLLPTLPSPLLFQNNYITIVGNINTLFTTQRPYKYMEFSQVVLNDDISFPEQFAVFSSGVNCPFVDLHSWPCHYFFPNCTKEPLISLNMIL